MNTPSPTVTCTNCANSIPPIVNHMMRCRHTPYMVHTGKRICHRYVAKKVP